MAKTLKLRMSPSMDQRRALREGRRVLRDGGWMSAVVYSTPQRNGFFSIPVSIIRRIANLSPPSPGLPGPFSLGAEGALEEAYRNAGFKEIKVHAVDAPLRLPSAAECARFERESFGALHAMLANVSPADRDRAWREIETELKQVEGPDGFVGPLRTTCRSSPQIKPLETGPRRVVQPGASGPGARNRQQGGADWFWHQALHWAEKAPGFAFCNQPNPQPETAGRKEGLDSEL